MGAQYLNTDLELESELDLTELVSALEGLGLSTLHLGPRDWTPWHATLETEVVCSEDGCSRENEATPTILGLLDAIDKLSAEHRQTLLGCTRLEFDIGYECQQEPFASGDLIGNDVLGRIVELGGSIKITIYREDKGDP